MRCGDAKLLSTVFNVAISWYDIEKISKRNIGDVQ